MEVNLSNTTVPQYMTSLVHLYSVVTGNRAMTRISGGNQHRLY